jgi:hypothetical protein
LLTVIINFVYIFVTCSLSIFIFDKQEL